MNKNLLKKIKYLLLPILLISVLFLTIPDIACALMPVKDWTQAAMDGLEEKYGPFAAFFLEIIIIYIILLVALWIVTSIFDWAIRLNLEYLVVVDNPATAQVENAMVAAGFDFISGIANMMLILIFIYIAFAIILKIESVGAKKILPRLIIVAFLLNFSLVFIGMAIDITNIFYVTFLPAPEYPLVWNIVDPLLTSAVTSIEVLFAAFIINALTLMIPIVNIGVMAATIVTAPFLLIPIIINLFLQAFIFILLIGIFLFYIALFIGRIVVIQILAILAPLAFICLILPQTKKYFNMWVKHFLSWLFVGLFLLFFLRLGFLLFGILAAQLGIGGATPLAIPFIGNIGAFFTFYLFVIIYLAILVTMAKKAIPEFAQAALSQAGSLAKYATAGWAMTGGHAFRHGIVGGRTGQIGDDIAERAGKIGERIGGGSESMTRVARWATGQAKKAGKDMAIGGRESLQKQGDKDKKECEGKSKEELGQITEGGPLTSDSRRMAASNQLSADGDADEDKMTDTEKVKLYKRQKAKGDTTAVKDFAANNIHLHEELGITKEVPSALSDEDKTRIKADNKKALEKVIKRKLKKSPESMSANILENEQTSRAVLENINSSQISRAVNADNTDFVNKISEKLKDMKAKDSTTLKEILNTNHSLRIHIESGMAQRNMGIDKDFLNSLNLN